MQKKILKRIGFYRWLACLGLVVLFSQKIGAQNDAPASVPLDTAINKSHKSTFVFLTMGYGAGTHLTGSVSLDFVTARHLFFSFGFTDQTRTSNNAPSGYRSGIFDIFGADGPEETLQQAFFTGGKIFPSKHSRFRYVLSGGLAIGRFTEPVNFVKKTSIPILIFGNSHSYSQKTTQTLGLILAPRIDIPVARWFGMSLGALATINRKSSGFAVIGSMQLGYLRQRFSR